MGPTEFLIPTLVTGLLWAAAAVRAQLPSPTTIFVLGDSLVDPGNNNYIATIAKSNFAPNGVDFPTKNANQATGRFCNGRTVADIITQRLNLPFLPAYLAPSTRGTAILGGVSFASAAGGILDSTGANYIGRASINQQIRWLQNTQLQFQLLLTPRVASQVFTKAIYFIVIGSNDYINNYLLPQSTTRPQYTPSEYQDLLISELSRQITEIYSMGARKILVFNVGPLGCIPSQIAGNNSPDGKCIDFINGYVQSYNAALRQLLLDLTDQLPGSLLVYANVYDLIADKVLNPGSYGLVNVNTGCCGLGQYNGQVPCIPGVHPCLNDDQYLFWDPFHPTDAVNVQLAEQIYSGGPSVMSPYNIQQIVAMP